MAASASPIVVPYHPYAGRRYVSLLVDDKQNAYVKQSIVQLGGEMVSVGDWQSVRGDKSICVILENNNTWDCRAPEIQKSALLEDIKEQKKAPTALFFNGKLIPVRKDAAFCRVPLGVSCKFDGDEGQEVEQEEQDQREKPEIDLLIVHWKRNEYPFKLRAAQATRFQIVSFKNKPGCVLLVRSDSLFDLWKDPIEGAPHFQSCTKFPLIKAAAHYLNEKHLKPIFSQTVDELKVGVNLDHAHVLGLYRGDCWYWTFRGFCRNRKTTCLYLHEPHMRAAFGDSRVGCRHFKRGLCKNGEDCDFKHEECGVEEESPRKMVSEKSSFSLFSRAMFVK